MVEHTEHGKNLKSHGLYLGKFAPFHVGHEYMIKEALKTVEDLTVLIYEAPGLTDVPLAQRAQWIREFSPKIEVIEKNNSKFKFLLDNVIFEKIPESNNSS